jgi:ubiquinone/menaquinone biosynthesis C-methylase UbiE
MEANMSVLEQNKKTAAVWNSSAPDYDAVSRYIAEGIAHAVTRLQITPGMRVLDVATGTGWTARQLARLGADVVGIDIADQAIAQAQNLSQQENLRIDFRVADAESLPFDEEEFAAVSSTFGIMFCADRSKAVSEVARVSKAGARFAVASWTPDSKVVDFRSALTPFVPAAPAPMESPFDWGNRDKLPTILSPHFNLLGVEFGTINARFADVEDALQIHLKGFGPLTALHAALDAAKQSELKSVVRAFFTAYATELGITVPFRYCVAVGQKL